MEELETLKKLGVHAALLESFADSMKEGHKSIQFTGIVSWLSKELQAVCNLECCVNPITDPNDSSTFLVEVSSFLKEMACPHQCLIEGPVSQRLLSDQSKIKLLNFLTSELCAARIIYSRKPSSPQAMVVEMQESDTAKILREMVMAFGFSKPPPHVTSVQLFSKMEAKLKDLVNKYPALEIGEPLFTGTLTAKQWFALEKLQGEMFEEYTGRRNTLLMRLDVTITSFTWSERLKTSDAKIAQVYNARRQMLSVTPSVHLADLLAARKDLVIVEKTSNASVRKNTKSSVNKVVIGSVPDRGGRPEEQQPPPPEVPSWQKNEPPKSSFSGSSGRGRSEKRPQSDGYSSQANVSNFSSSQNKSVPHSNSYGHQGKSYNYNNVQTEYVPQPSYGNYGSGGGFSGNRGDYRYQPQGGGMNTSFYSPDQRDINDCREGRQSRTQMKIDDQIIQHNIPCTLYMENVAYDSSFTQNNYSSSVNYLSDGNVSFPSTPCDILVPNEPYIGDIPVHYMMYQPQHVSPPPPFFLSVGNLQGGADFGLGFGGYGATGGNFQQYGVMAQPADDQDMYRSRGRGRSSRGGRGGRRGGRGGSDYYGGSRQY